MIIVRLLWDCWHVALWTRFPSRLLLYFHRPCLLYRLALTNKKARHTWAMELAGDSLRARVSAQVPAAGRSQSATRLDAFTTMSPELSTGCISAPDGGEVVSLGTDGRHDQF